jgi:surface polysaccharide O-acyltransferase-like enzyme
MYTASDPFYIEGDPNIFADFFISITSIWFMNLLFVLAGMSTALSLEKRSIKQYTSERVKKLLLPFIFGVLLTIPIQTYFAERFHNGYEGGFFEQYRIFFTKITDLTGYRGGLTPAHLWFLLFLFLISYLALPIIYYTKKKGRHPLVKFPHLWMLILLFLPVYAFSSIELGGEALGQYFSYFIIGYLILSYEENLQVVKKYRWLLTIAAIPLCILSAFLMDEIYLLPPLYFFALRHLASWTIILALLGLGQEFLNNTNKWAKYMANNSFSIYFVHQTVLVTLAFYIIPWSSNNVIAILLLITLGFLFSVSLCELLKRNAVTAFLFGMKK